MVPFGLLQLTYRHQMGRLYKMHHGTLVQVEEGHHSLFIACCVKCAMFNIIMCVSFFCKMNSCNKFQLHHKLRFSIIFCYKNIFNFTERETKR